MGISLRVFWLRIQIIRMRTEGLLLDKNREYKLFIAEQF